MPMLSSDLQNAVVVKVVLDYNSLSNSELLANLSTKCSWWAIVIGQYPSSVLERQQFALNDISSKPLGKLIRN